MIVIGLTGGIASGKSTAARYLEQLGAYVIDADRLGHRAYDPGTRAFEQVAETFGQDVIASDGNIDRKVLGSKVFGNPDALKQLTNIVWPEIRRLAELEIEQVRESGSHQVVVLEAAVLLEASWEDAVDLIWVVTVEPAVALERASSRDGVDKAAVQKRIDAQLSNDERRARADLVIDNSATEAALESALEASWQGLVKAP